MILRHFRVRRRVESSTWLDGGKIQNGYHNRMFASPYRLTTHTRRLRRPTSLRHALSIDRTHILCTIGSANRNANRSDSDVCMRAALCFCARIGRVIVCGESVAAPSAELLSGEQD